MKEMIAAGRFLHVIQLDTFCPTGARTPEPETAEQDQA